MTKKMPACLLALLSHYIIEQIRSEIDISLFNWARSRWFESFVALNFLYEQYREDWIIDFAKIIKEQGADYDSFTELWKRPLCKWTYETHIVNIGMMLKHEAISCDLLGESYTDSAERLFTVLKEYNSTPVGYLP